MSGHVLDQQSLAVAAPAYALIPYANFSLGNFGEVGAVDAEHHNQTVGIVEWKILGVVRAVLRGQRHIFSVKGDGQALDDLSDIEGVHDTRGFALEVDHADRIDVALSAALETDNGRVALRRDLNRVGRDRAHHVLLGVGDGGAVNRQDRNSVITVAGD